MHVKAEPSAILRVPCPNLHLWKYFAFGDSLPRPLREGMTSPRRDALHVPLASNAPPYRIDEAADGDCCVPLHRDGPDLLVLVPPGDGAADFRGRLISELQAYSVGSIVTRRYDRLLALLLYGVIPPLLVALVAVTGAGLFGFLAGSMLEHTAPFAALALLLGYGVVLLVPRLGLAPLLLSASYPADPLDALRDMPGSGLCYLTVDELSGGPAMDALRRTLPNSPASILPEERTALWVLGGRDQFYPSALSAVCRLAELRFDETVEARAREFAVEMQVVLDELESASGLAPPTSAW